MPVGQITQHPVNSRNDSSRSVFPAAQSQECFSNANARQYSDAYQPLQSDPKASLSGPPGPTYGKGANNSFTFRFPSPAHPRGHSYKRGRSSTSSHGSSFTPVQQSGTALETPAFNRFQPPPIEQPRHRVRDLIQFYPGAQNLNNLK